jgi:hypothetical protein
MNSFRRLGFLTILFVLTLTAVAMGQKRLKTITPGEYGGVGIQFVVGKRDVAIEYDCASGRITESLKADQKGNFVAKGFHKRESPGPIRLKLQPKEQAARYEGKISAGKIRFRVVLIETGEVVGEFIVDRGKEGRIRKCR